jgi:nicotinamide-nucleotide adenylyltransferase
MESLLSRSVEYETGVIHGRFQVLHNDHLKYLLAGKKLCHHLVIGITNPDPTMTEVEASDTKRSSVFANPLTYYERYQLVREALLESSVALDEFSIVPLPISTPDRYRYYVPLDAVYFLTIYDGWGRRKKRYFESLGLTVHVLWEVNFEDKGLSAGDIRLKMARGQDWTKAVPHGVAVLLNSWGIPERLKKLFKDDA